MAQYSAREDFEDSERIDLPEVGFTDKKRRKHHQRPTECAICGNEARGYHYEVASCNGCKTFFRRLFMTERTFSCKANEDCFDLKKRKKPIKCRACRYQKCVKAGMNLSSSKVDEAEVQTAEKQESSKKSSERNFEGKSTVFSRMLCTEENKMRKIIDMLTYLELKVEIFRQSAYSPDWKTLPGLFGLIEEQNKIGIAYKMDLELDRFLDQSDSSSSPTSDSLPHWNTCRSEGVTQPHGSVKKMWLLYDLLTTVEYAKTFMFFHKLNLQDRVALLQHVSLACMNLHISHYSINRKFDRVIHPDGTLAPHINGMVYAETTMSISPLLRYDVKSTEYVLLKAICLCNPVVPGLTEHARNLLSKERETFASILFDYCIRDPKLGPSHFAHLIGIIDTLEHQQKIQKDLHLLFVLRMRKRQMDKKFHVCLIDDIMEN